MTATDEHDGYTTRWVCIPPDMSASFRVLHDEWNDDLGRHVRRHERDAEL